MPEPRNRRRPASRSATPDDGVEVDGLVGRLVDRACDNPAMTGGLFVMALTAGAIVSNAMFLQSVHHPEPLFATRSPLIVERSVPQLPPVPPRRSDHTGSIPVPPPLPRPAPIETAVVDPAVAQTDIRRVQRALAETGLYLGAIDGEFGPLTRSAISAYEKAQGLTVTGEPSPALLERLEMSAVPLPSNAAADAAPPAVPALPEVEATVADSERLRNERVQAALNRIGYGPLAVDGAASEEMAGAIRRFELDNGLPLTGVAGDALIDRLIAIGALPST